MDKKQVDLLLIFDLICRILKHFSKRSRKEQNETSPDVPQSIQTVLPEEHRNP